MANADPVAPRDAHPRDLRAEIRAGRFTGVTSGVAPGFVQANLVALPREYASDFLLFCEANPRPCPVLEVTEAGGVEPRHLAPGADLRTDVPRYRVYMNGELTEEVTDTTAHWRDDLVAFLLGCSFTFEWALRQAGIPVRHIDAGTNVPMWRTSMECRPAGAFHGPLVVSMRPIPEGMVDRTAEITARFPTAHGAPIHVGDPAAIGITDIETPDWGDPPVFAPGDVPVFWACGVTPQAVALASRPAYMITHSPGHMFLSDVPNADLAARR
jgi:uncharacterized protein YcsI (UPF0317 family)